MANASDYTETNILNVRRGVAYPVPAGNFVALHTAAPSEDTGSNEVTLAAWPSYVRADVAQGGAIATGWTAPATDGTSKSMTNAKLLSYPTKDGAAPITVTHWSTWDAVSGGNMLDVTPLDTPVTIAVGDIHVFGIGALKLKAS